MSTAAGTGRSGTPRRQALLPLVVALGEWAVANESGIGQARARYDAVRINR